MTALLSAPILKTRRVPALRWTVERFHRARASGAFDGQRAILIRGVVLEQGPMNTPHAVAVELVTDAIRAIAPSGFRVRAQLPLVLGLDSDPFPDLALVAGSPRDSLATHPTTALMVVEISDSTLDTDLTDKAELYATAGIEEYWVLDLDSRVLNVFRNPLPIPIGGTSYRTHWKLTANETVSPLFNSAVNVSVSDLLP